MRPEVRDSLHHHLAIDLVVGPHVVHEVDIGEKAATLPGLLGTPPRGDHRTKAIGHAVGPAGRDQSMGLQGAGDGFQAEAHGSSDNHRFLLHDQVEEVEPPWFVVPCPGFRSLRAPYARRLESGEGARLGGGPVEDQRASDSRGKPLTDSFHMAEPVVDDVCFAIGRQVLSDETGEPPVAVLDMTAANHEDERLPVLLRDPLEIIVEIAKSCKDSVGSCLCSFVCQYESLRGVVASFPKHVSVLWFA